MIDATCYVPVLRWKSAEKRALQQLNSAMRLKVIPLIEFVPFDLEKTSPTTWARRAAKDILLHCGFRSPILIDTQHLSYSQTSQGLPTLLRELDSRIEVSLVSRLSANVEEKGFVSDCMARHKVHPCFRIPFYEARGARFRAAIDALLREVSKTPEEVDFIIDFQVLTEHAPSLTTMISGVPYLKEWKSFTLVSGSFPKDLSEFKKNDHHYVERADWLRWHEYAESGPERIPTYGDYTILHGIFEEQQGKRRNFSASVRYTLDDKWLIMKGEGVFNENSAGFGQWPAHAKILVSMPEFAGAEFSPGDSYVTEVASHTTKTGTAERWLSAGISHHIAKVLSQIRTGKLAQAVIQGTGPRG
jgi:hypothetical protein